MARTSYRLEFSPSFALKPLSTSTSHPHLAISYNIAGGEDPLTILSSNFLFVDLLLKVSSGHRALDLRHHAKVRYELVRVCNKHLWPKSLSSVVQLRKALVPSIPSSEA